MADAKSPDGAPTPADTLVREARAVAFSWHGVLFDQGRNAIHDALRATFLHWGIALLDADLDQTRGPTGLPQIRRLLSLPTVAEAFRSAKGRWATEHDLEAIARDLEPRLIEAARIAAEPNPAACEALRRLHSRGVRTAVICCTPRRLLGVQLERLAAAGLPLDAVITADEACEPAPAPWGVFEAVRQLGLPDADGLLYIDDSPLGPPAARNAGAHCVEFTMRGGPTTSADGWIGSLEDIR